VSDFWTDLQRWTEAQVAAILRGRIGAKRKDYLAADINKLLRDRINEPLAIKVGDKILAEFLRNGNRRGPFDYCVPVYSGLYSVSNYLYGDIYLPDPAPEGSTQSYAVTRQRTNGSWVADDFASYVYWENHFANPTGDAYRFPNSLVTKKAGLFTGAMKKVVQLLAGQNEEIPYGYSWAITHGIFINVQDQSKWVIEIESNGITTWKLEETTNQCPGGPSAIIWKIPVPVNDLSTIGGKTELCDADYLADIYPKGGPLLGPYESWAFSASGHEAQVVIAYSGFGPDDAYMKSFRYKLAFSADGNGDPSGVTLTLEQEGFVYTRDLGKNVRAPVLSACGPSLPIALFSAGLADPPVEGEFSFPLNVYYVGATEQVFTFNHKPQVVEDEQAPTEHPSMDPGDGLSWIYDPDWIGVDLYSGTRGVSTGGSTITGIPWAETNIDNTTTTNEYWHTLFTVSESTGAGGCLNATGDRATWGVYGSSHQLTKVATYYPSVSNLYQFCLIFPWFERESFLFQERWIESKLAETVQYTSTKRVLGTSWHESGSNAGLTDWVLIPEAYWCFPAPAIEKLVGTCAQSDPTPPVAITDYVPWQSGVFQLVTSGPTSVCCDETDQRFSYYGVGSTIAIDDVVNEEEELAGLIDTDIDAFAGSIPKKKAAQTIELPSAASTLFSSGLYDDIGACSVLNTSPTWFGIWLDAWTGNGWIKHEGYGATDSTIVGATLGQYPMFETLPISVEFSGWFGVPFPSGVDPE
jgi:hypothetical protein